MPEKYDENDPEVIRAKADAQEKILNARAKLHPAAQVAQTIFNSLSGCIAQIGCLIIILIIVIAFFAPQLIDLVFGR